MIIIGAAARLGQRCANTSIRNMSREEIADRT
jgi:hypothetical protein